MPIENNSNYNYPITVAGPTTFTATATADTAEIAEETARTQAFIKANSTYGVGTTQIVGREEVNVRLNNDADIFGSEVPTTYTATYTIQAEQISPAKTPDPVPTVAPPVVEVNPITFTPVSVVFPSPDPVVEVIVPPPNPNSVQASVIPRPPVDPPPNDYPPLPVTPGPLPDWYVSPPVTSPITAPPAVEVIAPESTAINPNPNGDPNPNAIITPGTGTNPVANVNVMGLQAPTNDARAQGTTQDTENKKTQDDWRVRLSLAPGSKYLYNATPAGILEYLKATNGVVFPYVPQIQVTYAANYETADIVHSNYKLVQYKNSAVDQISITGEFTAQDTYEANYMLAVIHFFKSVTKMFYGRDQIPKPGTPPPLCYLSGLGDFQFDNHPLVVSSFNYSLPNDVDYIRASGPTLMSGVNSSAYNAKGSEMSSSERRLQGGPNPPNVGAIKSDPNWRNTNTNIQPTYVPTKLQITITAFPMVTRNDISNRFSVRDYATGALLQGSKNKGGGIW